MASRVQANLETQPSWLDFLLSGIASMLAAYSAGAAVANMQISQIFSVAVLLGTGVSLMAQWTFRGTQVLKLSPVLYALGLIATFFCFRAILPMLPENPFTGQLVVAGFLCVLLIFGSFLAWGDQQMLFQAVPSVAIFGLVGSYDTFRNASFLFFAFLICFAALLARTHRRSMLRQAARSGVGGSSATEEDLAQKLENGPWRWVAGPQWAVGSAGVIILFSLIGAPIIQESVKGVAGVVRYTPPIGQRNRVNNPLTPFQGRDSTAIGRGPSQLSNMPVLRAELDRPRYLRSSIFQFYSVGTWRSDPAMQSSLAPDNPEEVLTNRPSVAEIKNPRRTRFTVERLHGRFSTIPTPGEMVNYDQPTDFRVRIDGLITPRDANRLIALSGESIEAEDVTIAVNAKEITNTGMMALVDSTGVAPRVYELANEVAKEGVTDYERALLLKREIERRARYNINATETPQGADPVDHFLFDSREGYCDVFASSMVLMARSIGIPARYVTGFYPSRGERGEDGRFVISEAEGHAWAELFFEDVGWIVFDATEGALEVEGSGVGDSNVAGEWQKNPLIRRAIDGMIGILAVLGAYAAYRSMKSRPAELRAKGALERLYVGFVKLITRTTGKHRMLNETPEEFLKGVQGQLGSAFADAEALNARFVRAFYSPSGATTEDVASLRSELQKLKLALRKNGRTAT